MPDSIPIRERVIHRFGDIVQAISGIGTVYRQDLRAFQQATLKSLDAVLLEGEDTMAEVFPGNPGYFEWELPIGVEVLISLAPDTLTNSSWLVSRWVALLLNATMADPYLTEAGGPQLAVAALAPTSVLVDGPQYEDQQGMWKAAVTYSARYRHDINNPYQYANVITTYTPATLPNWSKYGTHDVRGG